MNKLREKKNLPDEGIPLEDPPPYPSHGSPQTRLSLLVYFPFSSFFSCLLSLSLTPCFPSDPPTLSHPIRRLGPGWVCVCCHQGYCTQRRRATLCTVFAPAILPLIPLNGKPSAGLVIGGCCWSPSHALCVCVCVYICVCFHWVSCIRTPHRSPLLWESYPSFLFWTRGNKKV